MQILLAAATTNEISPTIEWLKKADAEPAHVLITGIGTTATAYALTRQICISRPDLIVQAGIAGSFSVQHPPGSVVFISEEVFADLGAIEQNRLTDIFDMGFAGSNDRPFTDRMLVNPDTEKFKTFASGFVRGATVSGISSYPAQANRILEKYQPVTESMEGAALHYVCLMENIPFIQLRAVSNFTGERNKANWKIKEAIANLNETLKALIAGLAGRTDIA